VREEAMSIAIERYLFPTLVRSLKRAGNFKLSALEVKVPPPLCLHVSLSLSARLHAFHAR
jgi:hypothetical protein